MSRIEEAFKLILARERGEPPRTASIQAEIEYWEARAKQAEYIEEMNDDRCELCPGD